MGTGQEVKDSGNITCRKHLSSRARAAQCTEHRPVHREVLAPFWSGMCPRLWAQSTVCVCGAGEGV